ncbi:hypothetical protein EDD86DRAFT_191877 [Gorgonomyces haynaldii]|nr:hypothetical protein EDD86DRAFT_191877 [Gorgonomyces haynaldii]
MGLAFSDAIRIYYERLFPIRDFYNWLTYGNIDKYLFVNREFSFTLPSEAYVRFQSFSDEQQLKQALINMSPVKIDIGAIYNMKPKERKSVRADAFIPLQRELVFDIDMTDYDDIRTCCSGADICLKCWDFMTISIQILHRSLTEEDFGFKNILWVYSGRRGVHCWVCDESARELTSEARKAIVSYLEIIKGGEKQDKKVNLRGKMHPSVSQSYSICSKFFPITMLDKMDILTSQKHWTQLLKLVPDENILTKLSEQWESNRLSSRERWNQLQQEINASKKPQLQMIIADIIMQYTYPRLDSNVSIGLNHLLKSPFCVHPKTGRVCVPIDPENCSSFDPFKVPLLDDLIVELDLQLEQSQILKPYLDLFHVFLQSMNESFREKLRQKRRQNEQTLQF